MAGQPGRDPIEYEYRFVAPSNTGIPSGRDLDKNGSVGGPNDAFGFGFFPGQYGMAVYSMFPINYDDIRTFQLFLWKDMPGAMLPVDPTTGESWYDEGDLEVFRLSSKNHADVPIMIGDKAVLLLGSANWDPRSLRLNFEFNVECYDANLATILENLVDAKIAAGELLTLEALDKRNIAVKLRDGLARLATPYL